MAIIGVKYPENNKKKKIIGFFLISSSSLVEKLFESNFPQF